MSESKLRLADKSHFQLKLGSSSQALLVRAIDELAELLPLLAFHPLHDTANTINIPMSLCRVFCSQTGPFLFANPNYPTIENQAPDTMRFIHSISINAVQASILRLSSQQEIPWHTHSGKGIHILLAPIVTTPEVIHHVARPIAGAEAPLIESQHYRKYELWRFNGEYSHTVENGGSRDRYCLQIYCLYGDSGFDQFLQRQDRIEGREA